MLEPEDPTSTTNPENESPYAADSQAATANAADAAPAPRKRAPRKAAADGATPRKRAPRKASADQPTLGVSAEPGPGTSTTPAADDAPADPGAAAGSAAAAADGPAAVPAKKAARKAAPRKAAAKKAAPPAADESGPAADEAAADPLATEPPAAEPPAEAAVPAKRAPRKRAAKKAAEPIVAADAADASADAAEAPAEGPTAASAAPGVLFRAPSEPTATRRRRSRSTADPAPIEISASADPQAVLADQRADLPADSDADEDELPGADPDDVREAAIEQASGARRRRRRGRRGRGSRAAEAEHADIEDDSDDADEPASDDAATADSAIDSASASSDDAAGGDSPGSTSRRRRRRRSGNGDDQGSDDPPNTVVHVREKRSDGHADSDDGVRGVKGSTRLEAKRQRRRDGRETTRRRAPILSESEFLARREAVDRVMAVRQTGERTQIAVLEDDILVEHYVTRASSTSYVGNVYLGRVQNVLPSMEAAFIDIGKGRNGVLYAGEVNWDAAGLEGKSRAIEHAMKSGDSVLVQVTKDPIGHKGARLTSQVSLPGRFLVFVPGGEMTGISRRLPDTERHRLKAILKKIVPEDAGVIVRTAAEGASEEDLAHDVERLTAQWANIEATTKQKSNAPVLVHGEPDLATRVVRDVFNEDFKRLVVQGDDAWTTVSEYVSGVAPDLGERVSRHAGENDLFAELRIDEQLRKALDRKVWLPSGGSLVIDRTEAMTVIDVNTGKFIGSGGNLEQTVTRNNLEAAEEIVRQLRLRDVGGIVVIDFIDMVLESNRELVLKRLTECLGRDRTKHQVAEVTSLGLVQMTRKRVGEGLLEAFSETCEVCNGRGVIIHGEPVDKSSNNGSSGWDDDADNGRGKSGRRRRGARAGGPAEPVEVLPPATDERRQAANAAIAAIHRAANGVEEGDVDADVDVDDAAPVGDSLLDELASGLVDAAQVGESQDGESRDAVPTAANGHGVAPAVGADSVVAEPVLAEPIPAEPVAVEPPSQTTTEAAQLAEQVLASVAIVENGAQPRPATAEEPEPAAPARRRRRAASRPAGPPVAPPGAG
ncbi:Rne/Rng family ribonuclease [uncultured Jatrophihabitans sp.]|uniref:Rne/Rng family ribonuclease n=1 Tax=uncultured Jatrophihabitans sp. TaxID=1610747 RepID=UPI0035CB92C7